MREIRVRPVILGGVVPKLAELVEEGTLDVSLLLNVEALRRAPAPAKEEVRFTLLSKLTQPYHISTQLTGHTDSVEDVDFSPDGKLLATASDDYTVRLWDVESGKPHGEPLKGQTKGVEGVAFSPDSKVLASDGYDGTVHLWDVESGKPHGEPLTGHAAGVSVVAFSPDGKLLASSSYDRTARLWEVESRQPVGQSLTGNPKGVWNMDFSPHGKLLASASDDKTVRLWDVATGKQLGGPLKSPKSSGLDVDFSPDGKLLASTCVTVRLWDIEVESLVSKACTIANRDLSRDEWSRFVGSEFDYVRTCSTLPAG